ncbi:MAG: efflux RND transporter periplasmic adaptor subunit [Planctomycetota bacterium]
MLPNNFHGPDPFPPRSVQKRLGGTFLTLLVLVTLVSLGGWFGFTRYRSQNVGVKLDDLILSSVTSGPFDHIVVEQGEIESSSNIELLCQIRQRGSTGTAILWVIDEGTPVKKGDKLVELDSSSLELELKEDRIEVITAEANVAMSEALLEQAKIAREEYLQGVYKTDEKAIQSEIKVAQQEMKKAQYALESSGRLVAKGLLNELQMEADRFALENARNQLESAESRLSVLQNLTRRKMLVQFDSDIDAAQARLSATQSELLEEQQELAEIENQIELCVLYAPADGVVVHANRYSSRGGNAEFVVEAGATVRERQAIIRLPDPSQMQVKCKVNESRVTLLREGMAARIKIDALPDLELRGRVTKVNRYAEPSSWFSSSIKEYAALVEIIDPPESIRTGMTAATEIFVEQLPEATQVPIQALYEHGGNMYSLVKDPAGDFETRAVTIGATNDSMASIEEGVADGETLVLNLREHLSLMDLPEIEAIDNSDMMELAIKAPSGAGGGKKPWDGQAAGFNARRGDWQGQPGAGPRQDVGRAQGEGRPRQGGGRPGGRPGGPGGRPGNGSFRDSSTESGKAAVEATAAEETDTMNTTAAS